MPKPALLVVCKPSLWPRLEPEIRNLVPGVFSRLVAGDKASDFGCEIDSSIGDPVVVLGGCQETTSVLSHMCASGAIHRVRWMHSYHVGLDAMNLHTVPQLPTSVPISNARGASSHLLAEHVMLAMLYFNRHVALRQEQKQRKIWQVADNIVARGQTVGILGYGDIGKAVAATTTRGFGMKAIGLKSSKGDAAATVTIPTHDELGTLLVYGLDEGLTHLLQSSDVVVNALPLTPDTAGVMNAAKFAQMRPSAIFVNVGRGQTVVEDDLAEALTNNTIRGAALDVFAVEPLPQESPLWKIPDSKLFLTAHDASPNFHSAGVKDAARQFAEYADRFVHHNELPSYLVDPKRGY